MRVDIILFFLLFGVSFVYFWMEIMSSPYYRSRKERENNCEPSFSFSSPLVSPVASPLPSPSNSPSISRSNSGSSISISHSVSSHESRSDLASLPTSPCPSPRESTKLPFSYSRRDNKDEHNGYEHHNGDLTVSDVFSDYSAEGFRCETPHDGHGDDEPLKTNRTVDLDVNDNSQLSYKHVQYMLDDNHKLSEEVKTLKGKLNILNGDHVSLAYQYQQLETKCQAKNAELIGLEGKLSALTVQLKSESEAKIEVQAKLALADSTIESLNRQIGVMAKSDFNARLRDNYEAMLHKLKNQHETDTIVLKGENEGLKYQLESKQAEIDILKVQLLEKEKALSSQEADKLSNVKDLKQKYENILRDTFNKVEFESILKRKNDEIESLNREITKLKSNLSNQSAQSSHSDVCKCGKKTIQSESECVKELKEEFEKCLGNLQTRRTQITTLQSQLTAIKKENLELKDKLREIDKMNDDSEFLKLSHEPLIKEIEARYAAQFDKDLKDAIRVMDKTQREEIERAFNQRLENYVDQLIKYLGSLSDIDYHEQDHDQLDNIFAPLKRLWTSINCNLDDRLNELEQKQQSMLEAKDTLAKVLNASKSFETSVPQSDLINQELEKIKEEVEQSRAKVDKYKRHYHRLIEKHEKEIEKLKNHYVKLVSEREKQYRQREEQLIEELSDNPLAMCRRLSNYVNYSTKDDR